MRLLCTLVILFIVSSGALAQESGNTANGGCYVPVTRFDPARDAGTDVNNAVIEAQRSGRNVLLDVGGDWCVWCRRLDTLFTQNPDLSEFMHKNYVVVKVNWSRENKNEKLLSQFPKIAGYPHLFVLDKNGALLHSQDTGELESAKHHDRDKVFAFLKRWAPR